MAFASVTGLVVAGVTGQLVQVEVDESSGLPSFGIVGLPDTSVNEARWRVRSALRSINARWPEGRITVSLSPAELRKAGAGLDLPIAVGILAAIGKVPRTALADTAFVGELGLGGEVRPVRGTLACGLAARRAGLTRIVTARRGSRDVARLPGISCVLAGHLATVLAVLEGSGAGDPPDDDPAEADDAASEIPDLRDVRGHAHARFALEVAAAGRHHVAMVGPPGVGKTLLAERLPGLLPDLPDDEALEVAAIHALAESARPGAQRRRPPYRSPHHSASDAALLGSVLSARVVPGAVTLAHRGVLFLDEAPEFDRSALEGLRQPLEAGTVALSRVAWSGVLPARFQLVLAANPCPCGQRAGSGAECSCTPMAVRRYAARLSGPMIDRIDVRLALDRPSVAELADVEPGESTADVRQRVTAARERAGARFAESPWRVNAQIPAGELRRRWLPDPAGADLLSAMERGGTNLRGPDRVLRMAWTLADLAGRDRPGREQVAVAAGLRGMAMSWAA